MLIHFACSCVTLTFSLATSRFSENRYSSMSDLDLFNSWAEQAQRIVENCHIVLAAFNLNQDQVSAWRVPAEQRCVQKVQRHCTGWRTEKTKAYFHEMSSISATDAQYNDWRAARCISAFQRKQFIAATLAQVFPWSPGEWQSLIAASAIVPNEDQPVQSIRTPQTTYKTLPRASRRHEMTSRDRAPLKYAVERYRLLLTSALTLNKRKATGYHRTFALNVLYVQTLSLH